MKSIKLDISISGNSLKRYCLFLLLSLYSTLSWGTYTRTYSFVFNAEDFQIVENNGISRIISDKHTLTYNPDSSNFAIPEIAVNLLIGKNESLNNVNASFSENTTWENIVIDTIPIATTNVGLPMFSNKPHCNSPRSTQIISPQIVSSGTFLSDGYKYIGLLITPFSYNSSTSELTLYSITTITLTFNGNNNNNYTPIISNGKIGNSMHDVLLDLVENPHEMNIFYPQSQQSTQSDWEYLIVAPSWAANYFQPLADWKTQKGVRAKVLTMSEINQYPGNSTQMKIKNALYDYYNGTFHGLKYVLLGGNASIIPVQECQIQYHSSYRDTTGYTPCDLFYACFDTMDWDTNRNGISGELSDSVDIAPEIVLTRAPINSGIDIVNFVNRIIKYESGSPDVCYSDGNILMAGSMRHYYYNGQSDSQETGEYIYNNSIKDYWNGQLVRLFDTYTDFPDSANYQCNAEHLQAELKKGYTFATVIAHGRQDLWGLENSYYLKYHADTLFNSCNTIIATTACLTNDFRVTSCLSNSFINAENSGILAYWGASRESWSSYSEDPLCIFFKSIFTTNAGFGLAATNAKLSYIGKSNKISLPYRWLMFTINPLGDPEMPIFTHKPKYQNDVRFQFVNNQLLVKSSSNDSCRICIMGNDNSGEPYYSVQQFRRTALFNGLSGNEYQICITRPEYLPLQATIKRTEYLQNETINGNRLITAERIFIGSDVTDSLPNGPIVIQTGTTTISKGLGVSITKDFEVKKGASLIIE